MVEAESGYRDCMNKEENVLSVMAPFDPCFPISQGECIALRTQTLFGSNHIDLSLKDSPSFLSRSLSLRSGTAKMRSDFHYRDR